LGGRLEHMMEDLSFFAKIIKNIESDNKRSVNFMFLNFGEESIQDITNSMRFALDRFIYASMGEEQDKIK
jgi:hypothetical protein